jgi:hypothetical protein
LEDIAVVGRLILKWTLKRNSVRKCTLDSLDENKDRGQALVNTVTDFEVI